ncbi:spindle and kinetochore-associated protein 2 [Dunckerocampus dactyliophorus]|uniref:spindle and kinetochore-associated protein 2 n=1 Tax=Dunckerocampus dactyliophorus TaxID=161453 RepID=UPI00240766E0|nr:spindle and kinetochore-associated protein 2 [Dunckerocampus dactyliophorus]XP_054610722.1 spindle and kinetochore-associated protein 2 [Dunckerocampus dactyliophorus]
METAVENLELMFSKSEAGLDHIEKRLKLDLNNHTAENGRFPEENPVMMLERLRAIKDKHAVLCSQMTEVAAAQKESMFSIRDNISRAVVLIQNLAQSGMEVHSLAESVQKLEEISMKIK